MRIEDFMKPNIYFTMTETIVAEAASELTEKFIGSLPKVARDNPRKLVDVLRRTDMIHAYDLAGYSSSRYRLLAGQDARKRNHGTTAPRTPGDSQAQAAGPRIYRRKILLNSVLSG
jgi:hypothetical protein